MIIANTFILAIKWEGMSKEDEDLAWALNFIISIFFIIECMIKLIGNGSRYFDDTWNRLDFILVALSVVVFILNALESFNGRASIQVLRCLRLTRAIKLFKNVQTLQNIV